MKSKFDAKHFLVAILATTLGTTAFAQNTPTQKDQPAKFKSATRLVLVPTSVEDKSGHFAAGLTKDSFSIEDNGKPRQVAIFEEVHGQGGRFQKEIQTPGVFTNMNATGPHKLTIIALDTANSTLADQSRARSAMLKFLQNSVTENNPTSLVVVSRTGTRLLFDFTSDPRMLAEALKKTKGETNSKEVSEPHPMTRANDGNASPVTDGGPQFNANADAQNIATNLDAFARGELKYSAFERYDRNWTILATLENLQHLALAYGGIPGRKELIWVTAGFPYSLDEPGAIVDKPLGSVFDRTFEMLNQANIAVYPVDLRGVLVNLFADISRCNSCGRSLSAGSAVDPGAAIDPTLSDRANNNATLETFAAMTGGRAFFNRNDVDKSLLEASNDASSYYMLGFYVGSDEKPGYRKLKVRAARGDLKVRARSGYFVSKNQLTAEQSKNMDLQDALTSPLEFTGVPMRLQWGPVTDGAETKKVQFILTLPPNSFTLDQENGNAIDLVIAAVARDEKGNDVGKLMQPLQGRFKPEAIEKLKQSGLPYPNAIPLKPGRYMVRFVVRDNTSGKIGSLILPLTVT